MNIHIVILNGVLLEADLKSRELKKQLLKISLPYPLAIHVLRGLDQVLRSTIIKDIKSIYNGSFFELSLIVILLIYLKAHDVGSFFDKNYLVTFADFFLDHGILINDSDHENLEDTSDEISVVLIFKSIKRKFKTCKFDRLLILQSLSNFIAISLYLFVAPAVVLAKCRILG